MNKSAYYLRDAAVGYIPDMPVLRDINLDLQTESIVALSGANGAGKSTLLKLLALELLPISGHMEVFGQPMVKETGCMRLRIGYLPQDPYLFDRSVLDNIIAGLCFRGMQRHAAKARAYTLLESLGLEFLLQRTIHELSGGERQKVAIVRLLLLDAEILLMDEPFSSLDLEARQELEALLKHACLMRERLLVFSSHDLLQAHILAERVLQVAGGTIFPAAEVNLYRGKVDAKAGMFHGERIHIHILPHDSSGVYAYVDPDVVVLATARPDTSMNNVFRGRICGLSKKTIGGGVLVAVDCDEMIRAHITAATAKSLDLKVGDLIWVGFKAAAVRVL